MKKKGSVLVSLVRWKDDSFVTTETDLDGRCECRTMNSANSIVIKMMNPAGLRSHCDEPISDFIHVFLPECPVSPFYASDLCAVLLKKFSSSSVILL